jgi:hypothetical protein
MLLLKPGKRSGFFEPDKRAFAALHTFYTSLRISMEERHSPSQDGTRR